MDQTTLQLRSLAKSLIVQEMSSKSAGVSGLATFHVIEKLRPHLAKLLGKDGFRALVTRAIELASVEFSWLDAIRVKPEGTLEGLEWPPPQIDSTEFLDGKLAVLAQLIGLLVALIGPNLTVTLVADIWPKLRSKISLSADGEVQGKEAE
jgi:hypothetical protein